MNSNGDSSYNEVFISYSRKNRDFAQKMVDAIYASGIDNVWVDWEDIEFSENWWERIKAGIESAHNFIFLMTPDSLRSQPCYDEIEHAVNTGKRIIPVLHMDIHDAEDHNRMHPAVAQHHWLNFREADDFDSSLRILLKTIETDLKHVRLHTRLLTRAKEWAKEGREDGRVLATTELQEAIKWLELAELKQKHPHPIDLQREYIDSSRRYHRRRRRFYFTFTFVSLLIAGLAISTLFLFQDSQRNLALVQERGTEVANQAQIAEENESTAIAAANSNSTQVVIANTAQAAAAENEATANAALATSVILRSTAESDAVVLGQLALNAVKTAEFNEIEARENLVQAEENLALAGTNAALAEANAATAEANAIRAEQNAALAEENSNRAEANAALAETEAARAEVNAGRAEENAATATIALGYAENALATSEASESLARAQSLALNAEQALKLGDTDLAIMLSLEAFEIDSHLIQAQNAIYRAADISPYFVVEDAYYASFSEDGSRFLSVDNDHLLIHVWDVASRERLLSLQGHLGRINDAVFSHDGKYIISASNDTSIIVWNAETGEQIYRKIGSDIAVWDIALHPSEAQFLSVGAFHEDVVSAGLDSRQYNSMILWDLETGDIIHRFARRAIPELRAEFRYDGQSIFSWSAENSATWDPNSGRIRNNYVYSYRGFNRSGKLAWTGGRVPLKNEVAHEYDEGTLQLWQTNTGAQRQIFRGFNWEEDEVRAIAFSLDERLMMVAVDTYAQAETGEFYITDQRLVLINVTSGDHILTHREGEVVDIESMYFLKDNRTILSITPDHRVILWDALNGELIQEIGISNQTMRFIALSPDERFVMMQTLENDLRIFEITQTNRQIVKQFDADNVDNFAFSFDSHEIFAISNAFLERYTIASGTQTLSLLPSNHIISSTFNPIDGTVFVSLENINNEGIVDGGNVFQFDLHSEENKAFEQFGERVCNLAISPDGRFMMVDGVYQGIVSQSKISDVIPENLRHELSDDAWDSYCPTADILQAMSHSGRYLAVMFPRNIGNDIQAGLAIYSSSTGRQLYELSGFFNLPKAIVFSPNNEFLFAAADNGILVYDVKTGEVLRRFSGHTAVVNDVAVSPDGRFLISASDDGNVILWDVASGQIVRRYRGHENAVQHVIFNVDASLAASSDGKKIIVWAVEEFSELRAWLNSNRYIPTLSCTERSQYNIRPLCSEQTPTSTPEPIVAPTATPFHWIETISQGVNVRASASLNADVITTLPAGEVLIVMEYTLEWFHVVLPDGTDGWIKREFATWQ